MQRTRVILTVDTEPDVAGAMRDRLRYPPLLDEPVWGDVEGSSEALGFITGTLKKYGLKATFFVEALHTNYFDPSKMQRYTDHLVENEQDVQLHIHPVWKNFSQRGEVSQQYNDDSAALSEQQLFDFIAEGCRQMQSWTGLWPTAMRTGNFSASLPVYRAMARNELPLASNICVASAMYEEAELRLTGGVQLVHGVWEMPVTSFTDPGPVGRGRSRAMQITACSAAEIVNLLEKSQSRGIHTLVLVTHPFEFIKRSDFRYSTIRPNRMVQRRLDKVCEFLRGNEDRFEVTTFGKLATELPLVAQHQPSLRSTVSKSIVRASQNFLNDRF